MKTDTAFNRTIKKHRELVANLSPALNPANVQYQDFPSIAVYKPIYARDEPLPTILYVPGNAFVAAETGYTHFICSHIAEESRCQVIVIKHRLAPEFQFPNGFKDVHQTVNLLLLSKKNPFGLQIDKTQVAIAGYSSGGNFAALLTIQAKLQNIPIARQILISPITDLSRSLKGFEVFEQKDTALSEQFVQWFFNLYIPKNVRPTDPKLSPYWTEESKLEALPPTDIIFGELDRFRRDSELYSQKLCQQGNTVHSLMFKQENHGLLWHNIKVINMISARLALSFGTERIERPLYTPTDSRITVLHLGKTIEKQKVQSSASKFF